MQFEWDDTKRVRNIEKHGIDFVLAALVFLDLQRTERIDERKNYGETRYQTIGVAKGIMLLVVYTKRLDMIRIISARKANRYERKTYLQHQ